MMQLCILQLHALKRMAYCGFSPHGPDEQIADACKLFPSRHVIRMVSKPWLQICCECHI